MILQSFALPVFLDLADAILDEFSIFTLTIWPSFHFTGASLKSIQFSHVPLSTALMFHQCIVAQLMQESLSYDSDMGQYLHLCSAYGDLENHVTILHLSRLLLHHLCFAHINRPSGNHIFILVHFIYTSQFAVSFNLQVFL